MIVSYWFEVEFEFLCNYKIFLRFVVKRTMSNKIRMMIDSGEDPRTK